MNDLYAKLGFTLVGTGGGCDAYAHSYLPDVPYILVTVQDDAHAPELDSDPILIGFYSSEEEEGESGMLYSMDWPRADDIEMALRFVLDEMPELAARFKLDSLIPR